VVIHVADEEAPPPRTLAEAAEAERRRRSQPGPAPVAVINDKNLADWAERGELTLATPGEGANPAEVAGDAAPAETGETAAAPSGAGAAGVSGVRDEAYWRDRARELRESWRRAHDDVDELEKRVAELRWQFYAEDDPFYRDSEIKPQWDRALDDLRRAHEDVRRSQEQLDELMEEGQRAGALPGWLREGIELEPEPEPPRRRPPAEHQSIEPPVMDEDDGGPGR
jgi:hypothetical protein